MSEVAPRLNAALEGRYRIREEIGRGGMATVYLADDLRHGRPVALKVLDPELAEALGADRFLAEIRTTANLQHPHILPLFDSGEADGFLFYVMPLVEGESLRDRLDRDHQLPVDNAVQLAKKLAEALDYAHRHGVIHRDIKPGNVLLHDGEPVLADFGIALAMESLVGNRLTETGRSLGTPQYMSPEQATGDQHVGPAADIYALGCVLYETLVGEPPFHGSTPQAILGRIITEAPPSATRERPTVPEHVDGAIRRALEKIPADRFQTSRDFAGALTDEGFRYGTTGKEPAASGTASRWRAAALAAVALAAVALLWGFTARDGGPTTDPQVIRYTVPIDSSGEARLGHARDTYFGRPDVRSMAWSPDGSTLAYGGWFRDADGALESALYLRRLDQEAVVKLLGGPGPSPKSPFFSPDGQWLGFSENGGIRRRSMVSGDVEVVVEQGVVPEAGFGWSDRGEILFVDVDGRLMGVPEAGGEPVEFTVGPIEPGERIAHPFPVPGTSLVLFSVLDFRFDYVGESRAVDLETGNQWVVLEDAMDARVLDSGYLLFMRTGSLMAVRFDPKKGETLGTPITILDAVSHAVAMPNTDEDRGTGQYAVSPTGHLAYATGGVFPMRQRRILRISEGGGVDSLDIERLEYGRVRVSPDGRSLALTTRGEGKQNGIYIHDIPRGVSRRLPVGASMQHSAFWSPDGSEIVYQAFDDRMLYRIAVEGGEAARLPVEAPNLTLVEWAPNGDILYLADGRQELWAVAQDGKIRRVLKLPQSMQGPTVSPDGRWLAYATSETQDREIYVRPYDEVGAPIRVSIDGGSSPVWAPDGRRLFFHNRGESELFRTLFAADVTLGETFETRAPYPVIAPWPIQIWGPVRLYDVGREGEFFGWAGDAFVERDFFSVDQLHLVLNFKADLERRFSEQGGG